MPPALTPALALDYVRELSADVRAAVVLDAAGELLAGPPQLADRARALLDAGAGAAELEVGNADGVVCAVRSAAHAAVAVCGRFAIPGVVREDLRTALAALEGRPPGSDAALAPLEGRPPGSDAALGARASLPRDPAPTPERAGKPAENPASTPERTGEHTTDDPLATAAAALISAAQSGFDT